MISVVIPAQTTALTTLARLKRELGIVDAIPDRDAWLDELIQQASDQIEALIGYRLAREVVEERLPGTGRTTMLLERTPVVRLLEVSSDEGDDLDLAGFLIEDAAAGILFREAPGFPDSRRREQIITNAPLDQIGTVPWRIRYTGGRLLASDNVHASGVSVTATAGHATLTNLPRPWPLLEAGDVVLLRGFSAPQNRGRFLVTARTSTEIELQGELANEAAAPAAAFVEVATAPDARTLEGYAIEAVKAWYFKAIGERDPDLASEHIGDWSASWRTTAGGSGFLDVLPATVVDAIEQRWRRET